MKVGVLASSVFEVNKKTLAYGGGERACAYFCEGLSKHADVTLFAPKGSAIEGCKVIETIDPPRKWDKDAERRAFEAYQHQLAGFDVVSSWTHEYIEFLRREVQFCKQMVGLQLNMVGIINHPRLIALSEFHRAHTKASFGFESRIVPHCIDFADFPLGPGPQEPSDPEALIFGLQAPHKGHYEAGKALDAAGVRFRMVGESKFVPNIVYPATLKKEFGDRVSGSISEKDKLALFGRSNCVVINSLVGEAFSMIAVEAAACGTPVLMRRLGCASEVIENGVTGFTFESEAELPDLIKRAATLDRKAVRAAAMERFDLNPVCSKYSEVLEAAISGEWW